MSQSFSGNVFGMQAGQDLYARVGDSGHQDRYGVFLATRAPTATCAATRWGNAATAPASSPSIPQPGRLLDAHRPGGAHRHRHHGQPPESQSQVHGGDTSSIKGRASHRVGLPIALKPNLSLAAGADHLPEYPHRFGQGFRVRRVLRAEERTHRPRWRARLQGEYRPRAPPGSPYVRADLEHTLGGRDKVDFSGGTTSTSAMGGTRRAWDWASRSRPASGSASTRRRDMASTWAASGAKRCRATWSADQLVNAAPGAAPDVPRSGHDGLRHSRPWRPFALAWAQRRRASAPSWLVTSTAAPSWRRPPTDRPPSRAMAHAEHSEARARPLAAGARDAICWGRDRGLGGLGVCPRFKPVDFPCRQSSCQYDPLFAKELSWLPEPSPCTVSCARPPSASTTFLDRDAVARWLPPYGYLCQVHELDARSAASTT